jgi:hypothetical protein
LIILILTLHLILGQITPRIETSQWVTHPQTTTPLACLTSWFLRVELPSSSRNIAGSTTYQSY